jgi:cell division protein FtsA
MNSRHPWFHEAWLQLYTAYIMAKEYKDIVVGLDIGTAKIMAVVAEVQANGELKLAGLGVSASNGLKRGVVVNIDATVQSIQQALKEAELMAACRIERVFTGITGSHIRGINSSGMVAIKDREVSPTDVARVIETAKAINISTDQRLLLVEAQEFIIDNQEVREPIGMSGIRLEAKVHIVTGAQAAAENIMKCVRRCGLEIDHLMLNPLAASLAVLTEDEKELGVALVDIGAGTTDIAIFQGGAIRHTAVIPIAGDLITNDIAMALRTPTKDAEDIKVESGCAKQLLADPEQQVEVPGLGDRGPRLLSRQALAGVIEPRVEEIFALVQQVIRESGHEEMLSSGIVLTGGSAVMPGMVELGEDIFLKPVRRAMPKYASALSDMVAQPRAATVMGLLEEARLARLRGYKVAQKAGSVSSALGQFKDWLVRNF